MRIPIIAGNWKMNTNVAEAIKLVTEIRPQLDSIISIEMVVCPPFISLVPVSEILQSSRVKLGAQNLYYEDKGAYTGEISPLMLSGICEYVIIGHSERRQHFNETGELIAKKVNAALKNNLKPILCIGENLKEFEDGNTQSVVGEQLNSSLEGIEKVVNLTLAYEPVWAIGTGRAASGKQAEETIEFIRSKIGKKYGNQAASNIRILYGGSVTSDNIAEFVSQPDIDGALVGGASLKSSEFTNIVKITADIYSGS